MSNDKISQNPAINAALHLDGDPAKVKAYYEDWARCYNADTAKADYSGPSIAAGLLKRHLDDPQSRLLDAGCGTGLVGATLQAAGYRNIDGFDLSDSMTTIASSRGHYRQLSAGIDIMQAARIYPPDTYDAVLAVGVFTLGHVPPQALTVLLQLLRAAGLLVLSTRLQYYTQTDFQGVVDDLIASGRLEMVQLLEDAPYNNDADAHYWVLRKSA